MKHSNLKFIIPLLIFLIGIASAWSIGHFSHSYFFALRQDNTVLHVIPEINVSSPKTISVDIEKPFVLPNLRFEDYPVSEIYKGKIAKLKLREDESIDRDYLQWAIENTEVDFAGHYLLVNKSCGMWYSSISIIDAKTGKVFGINVEDKLLETHLCRILFQS